MNALTLLARRSVVIARPALARMASPVLSLSSHFAYTDAPPRSFSTDERVPFEDYVDGHLLTDHLEYLDDLLDVTLKMEQSMADMQDTYNEKQAALAELVDTVELDALFEQWATKKAQMSAHISQLKAVLGNARAFASDAPDGTADAELRDAAREVNRIINDAAVLEDVDQVRTQHAFDRAVHKDRARDPQHDW